MSAAEESYPLPALWVIYTERIVECRDYYTSVGLSFAREQHDSGPVHYAATLPNNMVIELYPATAV